VVVTSFEPRKSDRELRGLVHGLEIRDMDEGPQPWFRRPVIMGVAVVVISALLYVGLEFV